MTAEPTPVEETVAPAVGAADLPALTGGAYHALAPQRILDTRDGTGGFNEPVGPSQAIAVQITGAGGVPASGVAAVVLNVTVTQPTATTHLTLFPTGSPLPDASNLNVVAGQTDPNLVEVRVGTGGQVSVYNNSGTAHVIFDVAGWVADTPPAAGATDGLFHPLPPARILDTRDGTGMSVPPTPISAAAVLSVPVSGQGGVPTDGVSAVVVNLTVVNPTVASYVTAFPAGEEVPLASNVNFVAGQVVPNRAIVKLGDLLGTGTVSIYNSKGTVDVIVDVTGYFTDGSDGEETGALFNAVTPTRVIDTRDGTGGLAARVTAGSPATFVVAGMGGVPTMTGQVPPTAVVANVTAVGSDAVSHLTVWPGGTDKPLASDLNFGADQVIPNLTVAKLGGDGSISIATNSGQVDVIVDVFGYYAGDVIMAEHTKLLDQASKDAMSAIDDTSVSFANTTSQLSGLAVGDVIVSDPTSTATNGFLRTVDTITPNGAGVVLGTSAASLADAIAVGDISDQRVLDADSLESIETFPDDPLQVAAPAGAAPAAGGAGASRTAPTVRGPSAQLGNPIHLPFNRTLAKSGGATITLNGGFDLVARADLQVRLRPTSATAKFTASADATLDANLIATYNGSFTKKITLADIRFVPIRLMVGWLPVYVRPETLVEIDSSGNVKATALAGITRTAHPKAGVEVTTDGAVTPFADMPVDPPSFTGPSASATVDVKAALVPFVGLDFYEAARIRVALAPYLRVNGDECGVSLFAGLDLVMDLELHFFKKSWADYETSNQLAEALVALGNTGLCGNTFTGYLVYKASHDSVFCSDPCEPDESHSHDSEQGAYTLHVDNDVVDKWTAEYHRLQDNDAGCGAAKVDLTADQDSLDSVGDFGIEQNVPTIRFSGSTGEFPYTQFVRSPDSGCVYVESFTSTSRGPVSNLLGVLDLVFPLDTGTPYGASTIEGTKHFDICALRFSSPDYLSCTSTWDVKWRLTRRADTDRDGIADAEDPSPLVDAGAPTIP